MSIVSQFIQVQLVCESCGATVTLTSQEPDKFRLRDAIREKGWHLLSKGASYEPHHVCRACMITHDNVKGFGDPA